MISQPINEIKIANFKSIPDMTLPLKNINIFIGPNGSGKSNILEAIGILSAATTGRVDDTSLYRRGVRPGVPRLYKSAFVEKRIAPHIYFEAHSSDAKYTVSLHNPLEQQQIIWRFKTEELRESGIPVFSRGPRKSTSGHAIKQLNQEDGLAALKMVELPESSYGRSLLTKLRDYAIFSPNTLTLRGLIPDMQSRDPVGLSGGSLADALMNLQKQAKSDVFLEEQYENYVSLIDWISNVDTSTATGSLLSPTIPRQKLSVRFHDRFMRDGKNELSGYDASEGALYILFVAVLALLPNAPSCFAIDNFDQALNPRLVQRLTSTICSRISPLKQILLTAHNPAVLDGIPLYDPQVQLFIVDRNAAGYTQCRPLIITDELVKLSEEKKWPLSQLWVSGDLGGVPNV